MGKLLAFGMIFAAVFVVSRAGASARTPTVYVTNARNDGGFEVDVYSEHAARLERRITSGFAGTTQIALDRSGVLYAANFGTPLDRYADASATVFPPGATAPSLTIVDGAYGASGVAVTPEGVVFVSDYYAGTVSLYRPGAIVPFANVTAVTPQTLAFKCGALYVGEPGFAKILRFTTRAPRGNTLALRAPGTLPQGALVSGGAFVVAGDGAVYAAGNVTADDVGYETFVDVFAPGGGRARTAVSVFSGRDAEQPPLLAIGAGRLYVSDQDAGVGEYELPSLHPQRTIATTAGVPHPVAVDEDGTLYVGDSGGLSVYLRGATAPLRRVALPVSGLALGVLARN